MTARGTAPDILYLKKTKTLIMISIRTGQGILNGIMIIPAAIMTKRIIEPDIPRNLKTKRSCLTSPGTGKDIKSEMTNDNPNVTTDRIIDMEKGKSLGIGTDGRHYILDTFPVLKKKEKKA